MALGLLIAGKGRASVLEEYSSLFVIAMFFFATAGLITHYVVAYHALRHFPTEESSRLAVHLQLGMGGYSEWRDAVRKHRLR